MYFLVGKEKIIKILLDHGDDINRRDRSLWTPLHFAGFEDQQKSVQFLLESGADINLVGNFTWTALDFATYLDRKKTVEAFKSHFGIIKLLTWAQENGKFPLATLHAKEISEIVYNYSFELLCMLI